jgi:hypothetical protein
MTTACRSGPGVAAGARDGVAAGARDGVATGARGGGLMTLVEPLSGIAA